MQAFDSQFLKVNTEEILFNDHGYQSFLLTILEILKELLNSKKKPSTISFYVRKERFITEYSLDYCDLAVTPQSTR